MHIDWFVFFAQIVNFLILVYLLKRFLYGRIIGAMEAREAKIAAGFEEVEKTREEAAVVKKEYEQKNRDLKEAYDDMMNRSIAEVDSRRKEMLEQARHDVDEIRTRWQETILREKDSFMQELRHRAGRQVYDVAKRVLTDLADAELEAKMADAFVRKIEGIKDEEFNAIKEASLSSGNGIVIQSAFTLSPEMHLKIDKALSRRVGKDTAATYETVEDIVSGIELRTPGHKIAWSLGDYLENLNESFSRALQEEARGRA